MKPLFTLLGKELREELRDLPGAAVVFLFPVLLVLVVHFALHPGPEQLTGVLAALPAWCLSMGVPLVLLHAGARERNTPIDLYLLASPVDPMWIFLSRTLLRSLWLLLMSWTAFFAGAFFLGAGWDGGALPGFLLITAVAALGASALGVLVEGLSRDHGSAHLAIILLPFLAPMVMALGDAGLLLLEGGTLAQIIGWLRLLVAFAILPVLVGVFFYERILRG